MSKFEHSALTLELLGPYRARGGSKFFQNGSQRSHSGAPGSVQCERDQCSSRMEHIAHTLELLGPYSARGVKVLPEWITALTFWSSWIHEV